LKLIGGGKDAAVSATGPESHHHGITGLGYFQCPAWGRPAIELIAKNMPQQHDRNMILERKGQAQSDYSAD
jgi:hypothetical protein